MNENKYLNKTIKKISLFRNCHRYNMNMFHLFLSIELSILRCVLKSKTEEGSFQNRKLDNQDFFRQVDKRCLGTKIL